MIREVTKDEIARCAAVIRQSFLTVAEEFGITEENAPRFTAFATTEERLLWQMEREHRQMLAYFHGEEIIGYCSLLMLENSGCELNNLCVLPPYRHRQVGRLLLMDALEWAGQAGCARMKLGIVEENQVLRRWYEGFGFRHTGVEKFDFFPFTCGYMEKELKWEGKCPAMRDG